MTAHSAYRTRRTLKPNQMDNGRAVPEGILREILEDAIWAPTHGLTQPWRFRVFSGSARQRLADALESLYDQLTPAAERREEKRAKFRANASEAPTVITVAAKIEPRGKITELDELCATACSVQNLMLSAHGHGLGSFWSTPPVACSGSFGEWLGFDATHRCLGIVYLGYPQMGAHPTSRRLPLEERVVFYSK